MIFRRRNISFFFKFAHRSVIIFIIIVDVVFLPNHLFRGDSSLTEFTNRLTITALLFQTPLLYDQLTFYTSQINSHSWRLPQCHGRPMFAGSNIKTFVWNSSTRDIGLEIEVRLDLYWMYKIDCTLSSILSSSSRSNSEVRFVLIWRIIHFWNRNAVNFNDS